MGRSLKISGRCFHYVVYDDPPTVHQRVESIVRGCDVRSKLCVPTILAALYLGYVDNTAVCFSDFERSFDRLTRGRSM